MTPVSAQRPRGNSVARNERVRGHDREWGLQTQKESRRALRSVATASVEAYTRRPLPAMSNHAQARAWIEVNASALRANFEAVRARVGARTAIIPMVKANGYGLGAQWAVRQIEPLNPWAFGVATSSEGADLRRWGVRRPVMVFSPLTPDGLAEAAEHDLIVAISD